MSENNSNGSVDVGNQNDFQNNEDENNDFEEEGEELVLNEPEVVDEEIPVGNLTRPNQGILIFDYNIFK